MQRPSTKLQGIADQQLQLLPGPPKVQSRPVSFDRIYTCTDTHDALMYGCELARLQPKQIYPDMGCDKTVWSRICSGELDLDGRDIPRFNAVVNNNAYLMFLCHRDGIDLASIRKVQDDKDRRIAQLEGQLEEAEREKRALVTAFKSISKA